MTVNQRVKYIMGLGIKAFAKDAAPAEVADTLAAVNEKDATDEYLKLTAAVAEITRRLDALEKRKEQEASDSLCVSGYKDLRAADSNAAILASIRAMKPVIAAISDPVERKRATDSLASAFRSQIGVAKVADTSASYAMLGKGMQTATDKKEPSPAERDAAYGADLKEKKHRQWG